MGDNPLDNYSPFDEEEKITSTHKSPTISVDYDEDDEEIKAYEERLNVLESRINAQETQLSVAQENGFVEVSFKEKENNQTQKSFYSNDEESFQNSSECNEDESS